MSLIHRFLILVLFSSASIQAAYWTSTEQINLPGAISTKASVSQDRFGVAVAVWEESNLPTSIIKGAILPLGATTWIPTGIISENGVIGRALPLVHHNANGDAIAIWLEQDVNEFVLRSAQLTKGEFDWISLGDVSQANFQNKEQHRLAVNASGHAVAVWIENYEGTNTLFAAKKRSEESAWTQSPLPVTLPTYNATSPSLAIDGAGTAVAVWRNFKQGVNVIAGALLPAKSLIWTGTGLLGSKEPPQAPRVVMNEKGKAVAVWAEGKPQKLRVKAATLTVGGTSWIPTTDVSAPVAITQQIPQVAIDAQGNALVTYTAINGGKQVLRSAHLPESTAVWTRRMDASASAEKIIPEGIHLADQKATAIFQSIQGTVYTLKGSTLAPNAQVWTMTNDLSTAGPYPFTVSSSFNASGTGSVVWDRNSNLEGSVQFGLFPPQNFDGLQYSDKPLIKKTWTNVLTWDAPQAGLPPARYRIYTDAVLTKELASVPGTQHSCVHPNVANQAYTYYIIAEDVFGGRSSAVSTTVEALKHTRT